MKKYITHFQLTPAAAIAIILFLLVSACSKDESTAPDVEEEHGEPCPGMPTVTYEGKTYNTVQIGTQCWLRENLDVGTKINSNEGGQLQKNNGIIEKYFYDNDELLGKTYGGLYEWDEAMQYDTTEGAQGICPVGWHIPSKAEFETLQGYVNNQGAALIHERYDLSYTPTVIQNNTGFSALFGGERSYFDGSFYSFLGNAYFWSSTEKDSLFASFLNMVGFFDSRKIELYNNHKITGLSVRCLRD